MNGDINKFDVNVKHYSMFMYWLKTGNTTSSEETEWTPTEGMDAAPV